MSDIRLDLPFGQAEFPVRIKAGNFAGVLHPKGSLAVESEEVLLSRAVIEPIGTPRLCEIVKSGQRVAIVISDHIRPCPTDRLIPYIINELGSSGIGFEDMVVIAALGIHRQMTETELRLVIGEPIANRVEILNHDPEDTIHLGVTSTGTPVELFRPLVEADFRICLGHLECHYFAGYSGGSKAILPGCASMQTVTANHAMMMDSKAVVGRLDDNPVRRDLEEGAAMLGADFILNVALNAHGYVVDAVAGDAIAAHRAGCARLTQRNLIKLPTLADIVLASAGGIPHDINLYRAHKGLENASYFVRPGGTIILVAECAEGFGHPILFNWLSQGTEPAAITRRICEKFVLGGHKAAAIAKILERAKVVLVSSIPPQQVRKSGMEPFRHPQEALDNVLGQARSRGKVLVLPHASSVSPILAAC